MSLRSFSLVAAAAVFSAHALAAPLNVLTTVKPLGLIVNELVEGAAENTVLMENIASPHDYALRPSDVKKIRQSDLIIWVGPQLESFMTSALKDRREGVITLLQTPDVHSVNFSAHEKKHEEMDEHHEPDHEAEHHHDHTGVDPHIWLGVEQARDIANYVTPYLIKMDMKNKALYEANLTKFLAQLDKTNTEILALLHPVEDKGYFVFHDAYGYFEDSFSTNNLGHLMVDPSRQPGAKTLAHIREAIQDKQAQCVFREPQFKSSFITMLLDGTDAKEGMLDPLATDIDVKPGAYFVFLRQLADSMASCLAR